MKLDYVQFGAMFTNCKRNPEFGLRLGYACSTIMTPEQFIRMNGIILIEESE